MKRILDAKALSPGDGTPRDPEEMLESISFNVHKFSNRPRPQNSKRIVMFSMFGEFGCETLAILYAVPNFLKNNPGYYTIAVGWYGRQYLYKHLVDEYWEAKEDFQYLREYARAFHNDSKNLKYLEKVIKKQCNCLVTAQQFGEIAVGSKCKRCHFVWGDLRNTQECPNCKSPRDQLEIGILGDIDFWKQKVVRIPKPNDAKQMEAWKYLKPNSVGVFARGRQTYGRNLQPEFYVKLIKLLEDMGYNPIWMGEKATTLPCPVDHIMDYSRMSNARDIELTLAMICQMKFTVQFWTASTRLAGMMGVPYLLFESPDQIWGNGQEGYRRNLCDFGPSKLAACHFLSVYNDNDAGIDCVKFCIEQMEKNNYDDVMGVLESPDVVAAMRETNLTRIGSRSISSDAGIDLLAPVNIDVTKLNGITMYNGS